MHSFSLNIEASKSESNRHLMLLAYAKKGFNGITWSSADDVQVLQNILSGKQGNIWNVGHAGTALRFLTAYACLQKEHITITGSSRIQERPIHELVELLTELGANIQYLEKKGFAPFVVKSSSLQSKKISLPALKSSQFISSLLLLGPFLPKGIQVEIHPNQTSFSYIQLTLDVLKAYKIPVIIQGRSIKIEPWNNHAHFQVEIESDWSSASYWYSISSIFNIPLKLAKYKSDSSQGDSILLNCFEHFGVHSLIENTVLQLKPNGVLRKDHFHFNCENCPDIAQTFIVTAFVLGMSCELTGLETLKNKECDRLMAMQTELAKFGGDLEIIDSGHIKLHKTQILVSDPILINTYNDHRMALAFVPLFMLFADVVEIEHPEVVSKSYPKFWDDLNDLMFFLENHSSE